MGKWVWCWMQLFFGGQYFNSLSSGPIYWQAYLQNVIIGNHIDVSTYKIYGNSAHMNVNMTPMAVLQIRRLEETAWNVTNRWRCHLTHKCFAVSQQFYWLRPVRIENGCQVPNEWMQQHKMQPKYEWINNAKSLMIRRVRTLSPTTTMPKHFTFFTFYAMKCAIHKSAVTINTQSHFFFSFGFSVRLETSALTCQAFS